MTEEKRLNSTLSDVLPADIQPAEVPEVTPGPARKKKDKPADTVPSIVDADDVEDNG